MKKLILTLIISSISLLLACQNPAIESTKLVEVTGNKLEYIDPETKQSKEAILTFDQSKDFSVFLNAIEQSRLFKGPMTSEGNHYLINIISQNNDSQKYYLWLNFNKDDSVVSGIIQNELNEVFLLTESSSKKIAILLSDNLKHEMN